MNGLDVRVEYFINKMKVRPEKLEQIKNTEATAQATEMKKLSSTILATTALH